VLLQANDKRRSDMTTKTKQTFNVGDVIEYQPRIGRPRIVQITALHPAGFDALSVGDRYTRSFGYYHQIVRVHRSINKKDVVHKTKTVGKGETFVAWECACGHTEVGMGKDADDAMHSARLQQRHHYDEARAGTEDEDEFDDEDVA
jgi:hypothetical protein